MLTRLAAVLLATLSFSGAAIAAPRPSQSEIQRHYNLMRTAQEAGTSVFINHPVCADVPGANGMYYPHPNVLVICQDNAEEYNGEEVEWTHNDLDTIRHETQHMVQDCVAGFHNGELKRVFADDKELIQFALTAVGEETLNRIAYVYTNQGASEEVIMLEFEAFSVASAVSPENIADAVRSTCTYNSQQTES